MKILKLFALTILLITVTGCENNQQTLCESYCDVWETAYINDANVFECSISNKAINKFNSECETSCTNAYWSAEDQYHTNIDTCLECLITNTDGNQRVLDFDELMRGENEKCAAECLPATTTQFFSSFFVMPPTCK